MAARAFRSPCAAPGHAGLRAATLLGLCVGTATLRAGGGAARQRTLREPFMTYNVRAFAPTIAEELWPEALRYEVRWPKVLRYVETAISASAVIALQQVEIAWVEMPGGLADVFAHKGYEWRCSRFYRRGFSPGVILAWPIKVYEWETAHRTDVASRIFQGGDPAHEMARKLHVELLSVALWHRSTSQLLTVATCYLPRYLRETLVKRRAQAIIMHLVVDTLQGYADGLPAILMGDFGFIPSSAPYALAADGNDHAAKHHPGALEGLPKTTRMRSAYKACFDIEPAFTMKRQSAVTTDYIWMGDGVAARECLRLPDSVEGPLPNELEGSVHVPVVAMLEVGPPTGLALDMPEVGDADIAGTFKTLVAKWNKVGKQGSEDTFKKKYMATYLPAKSLSLPQSPTGPDTDDQQEWDVDLRY